MKDKYVLIIEDSKNESDAVSAYLEKLGVEYKVAVNGTDALRLAQETPPVLMLMDLMLPGLNGFKLIHLLKSDDKLKEVPIIVMSILNGENNKSMAKELGAIEYLVKPLQPGEFADMLKKYL